MSERQNGVVKWYSDEKGYGYITPENGPDLMAMRARIQNYGAVPIVEGMPVTFVATQTHQGVLADQVILGG
ncbi:cold shock domain-containing protein [Streptomyces sp. NBC_01216]|uniref:cold-shock protein n=1 Tax=Streptomyces sp. NBC_01216 TaxID=2903778 RepID=UPI002E0E0F10|nr:cold shock domain-containing protein [Streptomyces sp. NBC_01216]